MIKVAQGHTASVDPIAVQLRIEEYPRYERSVDSDGIARNNGGAQAILSADALSYEEAWELLDQFGLSLYTPAARCSIVLPDIHRLPTLFYGVAELEVSRTEGNWWSDFRILLHGLVPSWQ